MKKLLFVIVAFVAFAFAAPGIVVACDLCGDTQITHQSDVTPMADVDLATAQKVETPGSSHLYAYHLYDLGRPPVAVGSASEPRARDVSFACGFFALNQYEDVNDFLTVAAGGGVVLRHGGKPGATA